MNFSEMEKEKTVRIIRPKNKFNPIEVEGAIRDIVNANLEGKVYDHMYVPDWTKQLTRKIHDKLKELQLERYKFAVQVIIGEDRGQGVKSIAGCILDEETDGRVVTLFSKDTIFCMAAVFVVYCYAFE